MKYELEKCFMLTLKEKRNSGKNKLAQFVMPQNI